MKLSLILLLVLPIVAYAAVLPRSYAETDAAPTTPHHDESFWDKVKEEFGKVKDAVKHDLDEVKETFDHLKDDVKGKIHDVLEKIKEQLKEQIDEAKKQLDALKEQAKEKYEEAQQKAKDVIQKVKYQVIEKMAIARMEFQKLQDEITGKIAQVIEEAKQKYGEIKPQIQETIEKVKKEAQEKLQQAKDQLSQAEEQLKQKLAQAEEEFNKLKDQTKEKYGEATEKAKQALAQAQEELKQKLAQAQEQYNKIKDQVKQEIQQIEDEIRHTIGKRDLTDIINQIKEKLAEIASKFEETIKNIEKQLKEKFDQAKQDIEKLKDQAKEKYEEVKEKIRQILGHVQDQVQQKLHEAEQEYNKLHDEAKDKLDQLEKEAKAKYGELKGKIAEDLKHAREVLDAKLHEATEKLQQAQKQAEEELKKAQEEFEKAKQEAKEKYPEAVEKVKEAVAKAEEQLKQKLAQAEQEYNKIKDEVEQELKKIADEIRHGGSNSFAAVGNEFENLAVFGDDPEIKMDTAQMAAHWGYDVETHNVTTQDGYILTVYRIPSGRNGDTGITHRPVVFLQHGLDGSSVDFVSNLPNQALAYVLADAGHDVWLGNFRGNKYSRAHTTLSPSNHQFWTFSWTEMADYDLPAMIDYALATSQAENLYYVGFSLGTTTAFAKLAEDAHFAQKIKKFYALGPMATVNHAKGPLRWMAPFTGAFEKITNLVGIDEFQPNQWLMDMAAKYFCGNVVTKLLCSNALFLIGGPNSNQLNTTRLPVYLSHSPSGTSTRTMIHIGQMMNSGKLQAFDLGDKKKNQERYHQDKPTEYDVTKIETPISFFSGGADWLASPEDVQNLMPKIRNVQGNTYLADFNHFDFIWGLRAAPQVYWPIRNDIRADFGPVGTPGTRRPTTPERQPTTPERQPTTPERHPTTPERQPTTPERQPTTPERQSTSEHQTASSIRPTPTTAQ